MLIAPPRTETRDSLLKLLAAVTPLFEAEPTHIALRPDRQIVFVGDTHGDLLSSRRVIDRYLPTSRLVFVGDYVDRAPEPGGSIANVAFLLRCKLAHPDRVIMLRGNHEFRSVFEECGFGDELTTIDSPERELTAAFERAFTQLPFVATTDNGAICLHGGLPDVWRKDELVEMPKGVADYLDHALVSQTVWNDHVATAAEMQHQLGFIDSPRVMKTGFSLLYGETYLRSKLEIAGAKVLIRGHDFRTKGYALNDRVLTIMTNRGCAAAGNIKGVFVARLDPRRRLNSARDLAIDTISER